jgi:hypothetical protein
MLSIGQEKLIAVTGYKCLGKTMDICPYYYGDYQICNISDRHQDEGIRQSYCMEKDAYRSCPNYNGASFNHKMNKKLRPDPAL